MSRESDTGNDVDLGQVWRSLDPRDVQRSRRVRVERITDSFVYVESLLAGRPGRRSRIHRSRFNGKQFELVSPKEGVG